MQTLNPSASLLALPLPSASSSGNSGNSGAAGIAPLRELPAPGELPPYTANQLGPRRAELSRALRQRLRAAGVSWPDWIDARPGRLQVILGDVSDPPLGSSAAALAERHGPLLLDGLAALGLLAGVSRLLLCASEPGTLGRLRALCAGTSVEVAALPAVYPPAPEAFVEQAGGRAYTVSAAELAGIGAIVQEAPAPHLCTIAGAVAKPQVLELALGGPARRAAAEVSAASGGRAPAALPGGCAQTPISGGLAQAALPGGQDGAAAAWSLAAPDGSGPTPAELVRRCGGARTAAWVAVAGGALGGVLWPADAPLPAATSLCLILPAAHALVTRLRRGAQWQARARNACLSCQACTDFCPVAQSGVPLFPHRLMRAYAAAPSAADADAGGGLAAGSAAACTGCGACSVMCPAELLPGALIRALTTPPSSNAGANAQGPSGAARAHLAPSALAIPPVPTAQQRVPLSLLLARLGLTEYLPPS